MKIKTLQPSQLNPLQIITKLENGSGTLSSDHFTNGREIDHYITLTTGSGICRPTISHMKGKSITTTKI